MSSITKLKTAQSVRFFDKSVALSLVQAFHRELDLDRLLELLFSQAQAIVQAVGLQYRNRSGNGNGSEINLFVKQRGRHTASYNLTYQEENLGELVVHFDVRVTEDSLETTEDLIALVMSPIRNALRHRAVVLDAPAVSLQPASGKTAVTPGKDDCLVLLKIDGLSEVRARDGKEWAQTLLQSAHMQIEDGLRGADAVFQIDEETLAILLQNTSCEHALDVAAKIRVLISSLHLKDGIVTQQLTACMGIASTRDASTAKLVLEQARSALDNAERKGRNEMAVYRFPSAG